MADNGPYETSEQVRLLPSVRAVYEAANADNRRGVLTGQSEKLITGACEQAGVVLGAYDARIVRWLAEGETQICAVVAGLIARAAQPEPGTVTRWALAYTHRPNVSGVPARRVIQPYPDEAEAREAVDGVRRLAPEDEPALMYREVGPWKEAP